MKRCEVVERGNYSNGQKNGHFENLFADYFEQGNYFYGKRKGRFTKLEANGCYEEIHYYEDKFNSNRNGETFKSNLKVSLNTNGEQDISQFSKQDCFLLSQ